jgi:hypothetical protein
MVVGDRDAYHRHVEAHLTSVDGSDASYALDYASHLFQTGGASSNALRWAKVAIANRTTWTGLEYENSTFNAYKLQAAINQMLWQSAENRYRKSPTEENAVSRTRARERTGEAAKAWFRFAKEIEQDWRSAESLCALAGTTCE